jgi:probable HAF family extracellular repeat protein
MSFPLVAAAQTFTYAAINFPNAKSTVANGINNGNVVVGTYIDSTDHTFGFRWQSGHYTKIHVPNSVQTFANGINDLGDVVGTYSLPGTSSQPANSHGFLLHAGIFKTIDCPGSQFSGAAGINKYGTIVGTCETSKGEEGFIYKNGSFRFLDAPVYGGAQDTKLTGISNLGEVTGVVFSGDNNRGFFISGSSLTDLDFLKPLFALDNFAGGVNGHGDIVGCSSASQAFLAFNPESNEGSESTEAFPRLHNFAPFGATNSCANSINYNRVIVGWYYDSSFVQHGFMAVTH